MERCRVISLRMVGVDSVDVAAATSHGIPVTNVPVNPTVLGRSGLVRWQPCSIERGPGV